MVKTNCTTFTSVYFYAKMDTTNEEFNHMKGGILMRGFKKAIALFAGIVLLFSCTISAAHGGHHYNGHHAYESENHYYHCNGHSAHLHPDGVCPYLSSAGTASSKYYKAATVKKVQNRLNKLGYKCGTPNGICGTKTKNAIKKFQKKKGITVNGKINKTLLKKLNLKL